MSAVGQVRPCHMRKQLADHEVPDAHAMRRGEARDVTGEAFRLRSTDADGSSEYSRLRGGIATGMSVHSGKMASPSAFMFGPPLPPDRELAGGRPVRFGEAVRSCLVWFDASN